MTTTTLVFANAYQPKAYQATYEVYRGELSFKIGSVTVELEKLTAQKWRIKTITKPGGMLALFVDSEQETSIWEEHMGMTRLLNYQKMNLNQDTLEIEWQVNWQQPAQILDSTKPKPYQLKADINELGSFQNIPHLIAKHLTQKQIKLPIFDDGQFKYQKFVITQQDVPIKALNKTVQTLLIERQETKRQLQLWISPEHNFIPAKISLEDHKQDKYSLLLSDVKFTH